MPRRTNTRATQGCGTIRKKIVKRNGCDYTYWEARVTVGKDLFTGKQIQKSISGKTQKEVRDKMQAMLVEVNTGTYTEPSKLTVSEWMDMWIADYLVDVKPRTLDSYKTTVKVHINPAIGSIKLCSLTTPLVQQFYNSLQRKNPPLSPKSIKNLHGVLHRALQQAVDIDYLRKNPANNCKLPRIYKQEIQPLDNDAIIAFLKAIKGHKFETIYKVTLFTGMREGEVLGLTWDCINFKTGTVTISKQLQKERGGNGEYHLVSTKNGKIRRLTPAASVMEMLRTQHQQQELMSFAAKELWDNKMNLVFTNEVGHNLSAQTVYLHFKKLATACGFPNARFHDLRHSYAVAALQSGDDIKTVHDNLGHHTAAFTLDTYGHVTTQMKIASANRMEKFINSVIC